MNSQATNNTSKEQEQEEEQEQLRSVQVAVPTMAPNANTTVMATPSHPHLIRSPPLTPYTPLSPRPITFSYKWICAPMVNASELAFRMMLRTSTPSILCYSPMIDVHRYLTDSSYHDVFTTCHTDRPLIIQLGGHDIDEMIKVGKMLQSQCDAIDINLGCPQRHARTHMYGAFLCDAPYRIHLIELIRRMRIELDVLITAKIRLQSTLHETLHLIHDLETCGVSLITIHGRTKGSVEQRRHGPANLDMIRDIIPSTSIPIITNGNVRCAADVIANLTYTHAHGIMVAEELLHQPLLFAQVEEMERQLSLSPTCTPSLPSSLTDSILLAHSYLSYASKYDTPYHIIHGHIYRIVHDDLFRFQLRREFAECPDLDTLHLHLLLLQQRRDSGTYKYDRAKHIQDKEWYASGFKLKRKRDGEEEIKQIQIQTQTQTKTQKKRIRTDASQEEQKEPSKDMSTQPARLTSKQRCRLRQKQAAAAKRQEKLADAAAAAAVANATATTSTSTSTSTSLSPSDSISSSSSHLDAIT